jgi:hypothetical protein
MILEKQIHKYNKIGLIIIIIMTVQSYARQLNILTNRTQSLGVYPILKSKLTGDW